ncbi:patatin-like phospholipase family protein [Oceanibaculum pacificum]|uniref:PNPLA domain-containing protein n=1 Tax=Oceanibaculum pacificum TaxID=580166 RepID=A0A154VGY2_9PROT|nr:patatin-like phospholipase family protein [Oceanibaculum pacificum]KZD00603.1 hypothetical protein AUP43_14275 [Oceanibaculum pacificum]
MTGAGRPKPYRINLALQGGGAHGAVTWGVLDRLLEDERLEFDGISGASAGAMNGAIVAHGLAEHGFTPEGRQAARDGLRRFWTGIGDAARFSPLQPSPLDRLVSNGNLDFSPGFHAVDMLWRTLSPYQFNPMNLNPLRDLLAEMVDFKRLSGAGPLQFFVSVTNVMTGQLEVFAKEKVSIDVLLASACLPQLFRAVEIDGAAYWDGGYTGNPALFPLMNHCQSPDIVVVQVNPIHARRAPVTATEIGDRVNEISFNSSLLRELRTIAYLTKLIDAGHVDPKAGLVRAYVHMIHAEEDMQGLGVSSKFNAEPAFLEQLYRIGRKTADAWLHRNYRALGQRSTLGK